MAPQSPTPRKDSASARNVGVVVALVLLVVILISAKTCSKERIMKPMGQAPGDNKLTYVQPGTGRST
jgi:hypothetical protein